MKNANINLTPLKPIVQEETKKLEKFQTGHIRNVAFKSGTLLHARSYDVDSSPYQIISTLTHPDYERFLDMRRERYGRTSIFHLGQNKTFASRNIHNKIVWGRFNRLIQRVNVEFKHDVQGKTMQAIEKKDLRLTI